MARWEGDDFVTFVDDGLQFRGKEDRAGSFRIPTLVEGGDTNGVACSDDTRGGYRFVEENEGEHAVKQVAEVLVMFFVLRKKYE